MSHVIVEDRPLLIELDIGASMSIISADSWTDLFQAPRPICNTCWWTDLF